MISVPALRRERFSGANGLYVLADVPAGTHIVAVLRIGFVPQQLTATETAGGTTTLDLQLVQIPVRLTGMTVRSSGDLRIDAPVGDTVPHLDNGWPAAVTVCWQPQVVSPLYHTGS